MIIPHYHRDNKSTIIHLKVMPNASKSEICGIIEGANSQLFLKVKVAAVPDNGKANKALIKFLAKSWSVSPSYIEIISGKTASIKKIVVRDISFNIEQYGN